MKDEAQRIAHLAKQCGQDAPICQAMWEAFCYRTSRQIGYLIMEHEMAMIFPQFAASFATLVTNGRTPVQALDDFFAIALGFAAEEEGGESDG